MTFKELPIGARFTIVFMNDNIVYTKINNNHYHLPNARHLKEQISVYPTTKVKEINNGL